MKLTPDTGSFETWVSPNCESSASPLLCMVNGGYWPPDSAQATALEETFVFDYGSGWAAGEYYEDRMYLGGELVLPPFYVSSWSWVCECRRERVRWLTYGR